MRDMFDDDSAGQALHGLTDEPAPPVATTLDEILRRGRRRVLVHRVGAAVGVMAVVAAIGVSAVLVRGGQNDGLRVADTPTSTTTPPPSSTSTPVLPPDWVQVKMPAGMQTGDNCQELTPESLPPERAVSLLPEEAVRAAYVSSINEVTGDSPALMISEWNDHSPKYEGPRGYLTVEIPVGDGVPGNGQLQLEVGRFGGTPTSIADASRAAYGNCAAPFRYNAEDGTVFQLYQTDSDTGDGRQPRQHLRIYGPDNRMYVITSAGYSNADIRENGGASATIVGGRGTLPTTPAELATIGMVFAGKLH